MARKKSRKARAKPSKRRTSGPSVAARSEWVGGRLLSPFFVTEGEPYRPEVVLWLELPQGLIVSHTLVDPAGREQVDLLLKDCENREAREPLSRRFDFSSRRAALGL